MWGNTRKPAVSSQCGTAIRLGSLQEQGSRLSLGNVSRVMFISQDWRAREKNPKHCYAIKCQTCKEEDGDLRVKGFSLTHLPLWVLPSPAAHPVCMERTCSWGLAPSQEDQWWHNHPPQPGSPGHPLLLGGWWAPCSQLCSGPQPQRWWASSE